MARTTYAIAWNIQDEVVGNAHGASDFEAGAGLRHVAHRATDTAGMIECDRAGFEIALPLIASAFFDHAKVPTLSFRCARVRAGGA